MSIKDLFSGDLTSRFSFKQLRLKNLMLVILLPAIILMSLIGNGTIFLYGTSFFEDQAKEYLMNVSKTSMNSLDQYLDDRMKEARFTAAVLSSGINDADFNFNYINKVLDDAIAEHNEEYENNMVIHPNGKIVASGKNKDKTVMVDFNNLPGFKENFDKSIAGKFWVSDVGRSPVTNFPVLLLTTPIRNNGKVVGIYGIAINLNTWSSKYLAGLKIGQSGYPYLITDKGVTVYHPDPKQVLANRMDLEVVREMVQRKEGFFNYTYEGLDKIVAFTSSRVVRWLLGITASEDDLYRSVYRFQYIVLFIALLFLAVIVAGIFYLSKKISGNLDLLKGEIKDFALGEADLTKKMVLKDIYEFMIIAEWFNKFIGSIGMIIKTVMETTVTLDGIMKNFENTVKLTTQSIHGQFTSIEQTSISLEEINEVSRLIQSRVKNIANLSGSLIDIVNSNYEKLEDMRGKVGELQGVTRANQREMRMLEQGTLQINDIMKTINDMANQTKIIAFNAALEASSGSQSDDMVKRFSVIASEIRRLAENVSESAGEIKEKLGGIQDTTRTMVDSFAATVKNMDAIYEVFDELYGEYEEIRNNGAVVSTEIGGINSSLENENSSISQIYSAILDIKKVNHDLLDLHERLNAEFGSVIGTFKNIENYIRSFKVS